MRKPCFKVFLIITTILLMFSITACTDITDKTDDEAYVVSINVKTHTIPSNAVAGQINLAQIKLNVLMSDNETIEIPVTDEMIFISDRGKLNRSGSHQISVMYGGMSAKFWITIQEAPVVYYTLNIINGTYKGQEPIEGNWSGTFSSGRRVTIEALDRSAEGYYFTSWTIGGQIVNKNATCEIDIDGDITIRANYALFQFKVTFDANNGTSVAQQETRLIETCPVTTRDEHVFVRWVESDTMAPVAFPYTVTRNVTLRAVWESLGLVYEKRIGDTGYTIVDYIYEGPRKTLEIPRTHGENENEHPIIRIAKDAFKNATTLESIKISKDIRDIDDYAFMNCVNLLSIEVDPDNAYFDDRNGVLFKDDKLIAYPAGRMLVSYDVENVSEIGIAAFYHANVGSINIKSTIHRIGDNAFNSRTIDNVIFNNRVSAEMAYAENIFNHNINSIFIVQNTHLNGYLNHSAFLPYAHKIEELMTTPIIGIHNNLLYRVISREIESIPTSTIEIIGARRNIESLIIPTITIEGKYITSIGSYAFSYCYNLKTIEFPVQMKVDRIMRGAFDNTKWQNAPEHNYIRDGLIIINGQLFRCLEDRSQYVIPHTVTRISESSFSNMTKLTTIVFDVDGNGNRLLTVIDAKAFENCINLTNITIPKTVNKIGKSAFENTGLANFGIEINSILTTIDDYSFRNAAQLTSFNLGVNVQNLGVGIFNGCYSLEQILIDNDINGESEYYIVKDGVLFEKNRNLVNDIDNFGQILHTYPAGRIDDIYTLPFDGVKGVTHIREFAFYYSNIGAIVLPPTIESIVKHSIVVPHLVYLEFTDSISVDIYNTLFPEFGPTHIIICENQNLVELSTWWPSGSFTRKSQIGSLNIQLGVFQSPEGEKYLYRRDIDGMFILGAERTRESMTIPVTISIGMSNYSVNGIEGYAFMGHILKEITLPSTIGIIKSYAFYYSPEIKKITSYKLTAPDLEYSDISLGAEAILSFNPTTIIENALIYVPANKEQEYADNWPTTINFILEIGTQLAISFDSLGGSAPVLYDTSGNPYDLSALDVIPASPFTQKEGYIFDGWYDNPEGSGERTIFPYTKFKKITLYAKWLVRSFELTYQLGGGDFVEENPLNVVYYGEPYILPVPVRAGYNFKGWSDFDGNPYTDEFGTGLTNWSVINDSLILLATWEEKDITVTYDANGGTTSQPTKVITYLSIFNLEVPVRQGYRFLRWEDQTGKIITFSNGSGINNWTYTEDITVKAIWQALTYTVTFDDGQGTIIAPVTVTYDDDAFVFEVPVKADSVFFGWYNGVGGTGIQYTDENGNGIRPWDIAANVTMYAQWPINISDANGLLSINDSLEGSYILTNDIYLVDEWEPIGLNQNAPFIGILDGNGYSIYNLTITDTNLGFVGLIGYNRGIIRNLNLGINDDKTNRADRTNIELSDNDGARDIFVGGLVGYNDTSGSVINCKVAVQINTVVDCQSKYLYVGGLVGYNKGRIEQTYLVTQINTSLDDENTEPSNMYRGTMAGYHSSEGVIVDCSYDRIVSSSDILTKACGNEQESGFGSFDAIGRTTQEEW